MTWREIDAELERVISAYAEALEQFCKELNRLDWIIKACHTPMDTEELFIAAICKRVIKTYTKEMALIKEDYSWKSTKEAAVELIINSL